MKIFFWSKFVGTLPKQRGEENAGGIDTPLAVAEPCSELRFLSHESLRGVLLNTKQELIKVVSVSQGTLDEALAHPREVFKPVIAFSAYAFIVVHNHPSGDPFPFRSVEEGARGQR